MNCFYPLLPTHIKPTHRVATLQRGRRVDLLPRLQPRMLLQPGQLRLLQQLQPLLHPASLARPTAEGIARTATEKKNNIILVSRQSHISIASPITSHTKDYARSPKTLGSMIFIGMPNNLSTVQAHKIQQSIAVATQSHMEI